MLNSIYAKLLDLVLRIACISVLFFAGKRVGKKEAATENMEALKDAARKEAQDWANRPSDADIPDRLREAARKRKGRP